MKTTSEEINRLEDAEEQISDLKDKVMESTNSEQQKGKKEFKKRSTGLSDFLDNIK